MRWCIETKRKASSLFAPATRRHANKPKRPRQASLKRTQKNLTLSARVPTACAGVASASIPQDCDR